RLVVRSANPAVKFGRLEIQLLEFGALQLQMILERAAPQAAPVAPENTQEMAPVIPDPVPSANPMLDEVTQIPRRELFLLLLNQALSRGRRNKELVAVLSLSLDGYSEIARKSSQTAKQVIKQVTERLKRNVREGDSVAR